MLDFLRYLLPEVEDPLGDELAVVLRRHRHVLCPFPDPLRSIAELSHFDCHSPRAALFTRIGRRVVAERVNNIARLDRLDASALRGDSKKKKLFLFPSLDLIDHRPSIIFFLSSILISTTLRDEILLGN